MEIDDLKTKIYYACREHLYNMMIKACQEGLNKFPGDASFRLYKALALILCTHLDEGIRELELLKSHNEMRLAIVVARTFAHKLIASTDREFLYKLDAQTREYKKNATSTDFYCTAYVLFCFNKFEKAYDCVEQSLKGDVDSLDSLCLKGWLQLYLVRAKGSSDYSGATESFNSCLEGNKRMLDASFGIVECQVGQDNSGEAMNILNKAIIQFPSYNLPLIQKMKCEFSLKKWDQAAETMKRIFASDSNNLEAMKISILILLCREYKDEDAANSIRAFFHEILTNEPSNAAYLCENSQLFSRISSRSNYVLAETYKMVEKVVQICPTNAEYLTELGYQCILKGNLKEASRFYKSASKINGSSVNALLGLTFCELLESGVTEQLNHQIEFLIELQDSAVPMLLFMQAKVSESSEMALKFLKEAYEAQIKILSGYPYSAAYLRLLDPDFLLEIVKELQKYVSHTFIKSNPVVNMAVNILQTVVKACPGCDEGQYFLAKMLYLNGNITESVSTLQRILNDSSPTSTDAYLLMAQIQVNKGYYDRATQSLESGLSHNFKVRENALYHQISGLIQKNLSNLDEAIKCFTIALSLANTAAKKQTADTQNELSLAEKAAIYTELIDVHMKVDHTHEAAKLLEEATDKFRGTPEEARIAILSAEHAIKRQNVQSAIDMLTKIKSTDSNYLAAKTKLAQIFLNFRRDKGAYLKCYQEMVNNNPVPESYVLLGDAFMHILEPKEALKSYNDALQLNPKDPLLTSKMGQALVKTHYYKKAVEYYKDTIKVTNDPELKLQLASLYMRLKQHTEAEMLLLSEIEAQNQRKLEDLITLQYQTKLFKLLSQVLEKLGNTAAALSKLKDARENQTRVLKRYSVEQTAVPDEELSCAKEISIKLAELSTDLRDHDQAVQHYKDALLMDSNDSKTLTALSKLYMQLNHLDLCQQTCNILLKLDPENETASIIMADISFHKVDFEMAAIHFVQLLNKQPTYWTALARLVEVKRRTGNLEEIPQYLEKAEKNCVSSKEAGLCYCTALYQQYTGNLNAALRNFNTARQDQEWGAKALSSMIEICLNPEDEMVGDRIIDGDDVEYRDSRTMALRTAERLLKELKLKSDNAEDRLNSRLLGNFLLLATKEKSNIESALEDFISIASQDLYKDHLGPILGIATTYTLLKQGQKARNQLKRVVKNIWTYEDAEYLERCWLLLADCYIQSSKYDTASDLLKRVLEYNKSSIKAYEYLGFIWEKEQSFKNAANFYENAWKFGGKCNLAVGYKLAFSFMKCKRYADAIDVSQQVLAFNPDYPRIKKDILDKSLNNLRI